MSAEGGIWEAGVGAGVEAGVGAGVGAGAALLLSYPHVWFSHNPENRISSRVLPRRGLGPALLRAETGVGQDYFFYYRDPWVSSIAWCRWQWIMGIGIVLIYATTRQIRGDRTTFSALRPSGFVY